MTISSGQTITAANLDAACESNITALTTAAQARAKDFQIGLEVEALATTGIIEALRSVEFVPEDDMELRTVAAQVRTSDTTPSTTTVTLEIVTDDAGTADDEYMLEETVTASVTHSAAGTHDARTSYELATGTKIFLLKGIRYRLIVSTSAGTHTKVQFWLTARVKTRPRTGLPWKAWDFRTAATLSPHELNTALEKLKGDLDRDIDSRWTYSHYVVPFRQYIDETDNDEIGTVRIESPYPYDIVGVDAYLCSATAPWTVSMSSVTSETNTFTATATATPHCGRTQNRTILAVPHSEEMVYTVTAGTAATLLGGYLVVYIRHDRHLGSNGVKPSWTPTTYKDGVTPDATAVAADFAAYVTAADLSDTTNDKQLRIEVIDRRNWLNANFGSAYYQYSAIAASGKRLDSLYAFLYSDTVGTVVDFVLDNEAGTPLKSVELTTSDADIKVSGAKTVNQTQDYDDPDNSARDWTVQFNPTTGGSDNILKAYVVLIWT